jgi:glutaconyl-CoA/methylmalonyl-CoA decarboxylase subunit gamma
VKRRFAVKIGDRERIVELDDGAARVDGRDVDVSCAQVSPGIWSLRRGSEQTIAQVDALGSSASSSKLAVEIRRPGADAVVVAAEVTDARRASIVAPARPAGAAAPVVVRSPIPGRVVKVLVKAGDAAAAGQTLVVLEAMKMENELRAPRAGRVLDVRCTEGATVESGQDLVTVG